MFIFIDTGQCRTWHIAVKCNPLTLQFKCVIHCTDTQRCVAANPRRLMRVLCLLSVLSGLASSPATSSAARSGTRTSTSARGWGKTTCTQNKPRRRYSTCERTRTLRSHRSPNAPHPSLQAGSSRVNVCTKHHF